MSGRYELLQPLAARDKGLGSKSRLGPENIVVRRVTLGLPFVICVLVVLAYIRHVEPVPSLPLKSPPHGTLGIDYLEQCTSTLPRPATPPAPINLWASLTIDESVQIQKWLQDTGRNLNLTLDDTAKLNDNFVILIEAYYPRKADALAYLAAPSTTARPKRFARVTLFHGSDPEPAIKDYLVGPLPIGPNTTMRRLTEIYHRDQVPSNARGYNPRTDARFLISQISRQLGDVIQELFGATVAGLPNDTLVPAGSAPYSFDGSFRRIWFHWRRNAGGTWLHPVNFFQYVDLSGTDRAQWKILKIMYNHQVFSSVESFLEAFHNGTLKRLPDLGQNTDLTWSSRKRVGAQRDLDNLPGPRSVSFAGLRFRVDRQTQYISWMGWGLYLGFDKDMGLSLWDVRLKGERILYQLAPQEALSQYAGNDPMQATTAWLDRFFGMGGTVRDMVPGYDCPHEAVYLPETVHMTFGYITLENAVCIFEQDTGRPLTRHEGRMAGEFGVVRGYVLTIRSISTVGNYDYYGTIEVRLSASGYLQAGYWEPLQDDYGTKIRERTMGNLHDHVINFKGSHSSHVDLDVVGTHNSLLHTSTFQEEVKQTWPDDDWGESRMQQKISRKYITTENDALLKFPMNFQGGYALVNQAETNSWGVPRGYAIHPGYSPIHNTVVGSRRLLHNANWARYNMAVSRRKETEPTSSNKWNQNLPGAPMVDFHKFFDGENITQEDLVAWVNIGMHHIPQSEDGPNTRTNTATSSFFLTPLNYFDSDISMDSTNAVVLEVPSNSGEPYTFNDYGVKPLACVPEAPAPLEYTGLKVFGLDGKRTSFNPDVDSTT